MSKAFYRSAVLTANFAQQLFQARAQHKGDTKNFQVTLSSPKEDPFWKELQSQIDAVCVERWGEIPKRLRHPIIKDSKNVDWMESDDMNFFAPKRAESDGAPEVIEKSTRRDVPNSEIYSGMECMVTYRLVAYDNDFGKGVSCYLDNAMKIADGERIGRAVPKAVNQFADDLDEGDDVGDSMLD